jgi:tetratricopeptide (TPR) repeat protein
MRISNKSQIIILMVISVVGITFFGAFLWNVSSNQQKLSTSVAMMNSTVQDIKEKRYEAAILNGKASVQAYPQGFWGHLYLGIAYSQYGNHPGAIAELQTANRIQVTNEANLYLAKSYQALGKIDEAKRYTSKVEQGNDLQLAAEARNLQDLMHKPGR